MPNNYEDILALLKKLPAEQKDNVEGITSLVKALNQERGKALSDVNDLKTQFSVVKEENEKFKGDALTYQELMDKLAKSGVEAKDAEAIAQKLKVEKTKDDELVIAKKLLDDATKKNKQYEAEEQKQKIKQALEGKLTEAIKGFKDKDGNEVKLMQDFIDKEALYSKIDLESEPLVNERIRTELQKAFDKQAAMLNSMAEQKIIPEAHKVDTTGSKHFNDGKSEFDMKESRDTINKAGGTPDAVAMEIAKYEASGKSLNE